MNFTVIPFFLATSVVIEDPNVWQYGPEFVYETTNTLLFFGEPSYQPTYATNITNVMKCRPTSDTSILCRLSDTAMYSSHKNTPETTDLSEPFEIIFNSRGVDSVMFTERIEKETALLLKLIVNEFNVGVNLEKHTESFPAFEARESQIMGDCTTSFRIENHNNDRDNVDSTKNRRYTLNVLTLPKEKSGSTVEIRKRTDLKSCMSPSANNDIPLPNYRLPRAFSEMNITKDGTFESLTEYIRIPMFKIMVTGKQDFRVITYVALKDIQPATVPLVPVHFHDSTSLHSSDEVQFNHIG